MPGIKNHNPFVRQYQKRRIIVIIRLKIGTNQYLVLSFLFKVILHRFNIAVYINIADICLVYCTFFILIMQRTRISEPTPGSFGSYFIHLRRCYIFITAGIYCVNFVSLHRQQMTEQI